MVSPTLPEGYRPEMQPCGTIFVPALARFGDPWDEFPAACFTVSYYTVVRITRVRSSEREGTFRVWTHLCHSMRCPGPPDQPCHIPLPMD
jgi:hypothetical protein